jgi:hypothetical protein
MKGTVPTLVVRSLDEDLITVLTDGDVNRDLDV